MPFDLKDYITVAERVTAFYGKYPEGSLQSEIVELNESRVVMRAYAYRTPGDERPGIGYSQLGIPGNGVTRNSEIETCETSAWGRAIAALGFEVKRGIASRDEIENKQDGEIPPKRAAEPRVVTVGNTPVDVSKTPDGGLIGVFTVKDRYDANLRQSPDSEWVLPFKIKAGSTSFGVVAEGDLAYALDAIKSTVIDQRVTVWGHWTDEFTPGKGTRPDVKWRLLHLERIQTPDGLLPMEPPADVQLIGEAESEPLGLVS
jgi:hypothetical protein